MGFGPGRDAFVVGANLVRRGDVESGRGALISCVSAADPEWSPRAAGLLGELLWQRGDPDGAEPDARALVERAPMSAEASEETRVAVVGYRDAMTYVQQAPLLGFFEYSETLLSTMHFMITKYQPAKRPGRYREGGIFVTSADPLEPAYTGPDADQVPGLMAELVEWLRDGDTGAPAYA